VITEKVAMRALYLLTKTLFASLEGKGENA